MSVEENISLPLEMEYLNTAQRLPFLGNFISGSRPRKATIKGKVSAVADLVEIGHLLDRHPAQLSGGQRQRVALARAIIREPGLFLMDEPLSNLDAKLRVTMRAELTALNKRLGATMLYVTHDQVEAMTMSDKIALMMDGEILQFDTPEKLYSSPMHLDVATFLGQPTINCLAAKGGSPLQVEEADMISLAAAANDTDLTLAVRPEALTLRHQQVANARFSVPVSLDRVELLGSEVLLWCTAKLSGKTLVAQARTTEHNILVESGKTTGNLWLDADADGLHVFDSDGVSIPFTSYGHDGSVCELQEVS